MWLVHDGMGAGSGEEGHGGHDGGGGEIHHESNSIQISFLIAGRFRSCSSSCQTRIEADRSGKLIKAREFQGEMRLFEVIDLEKEVSV
jgi:hypothetical protein